jgi:GT2 family glycosyltransferase
MTAAPANPAAPPPVVSVVIAAYNYGRFLPETLACLRAQTLADWECVVVDDGSTDDTPAVLAAAARADPRIRCAVQPNRGQPTARNAALVLARGRYVQLLDADDLLEPKKLACQAACLDERPDVDIVYGNCRYFPTDRSAERRHSLAGPDEPWMPCPSGAGREIIAALLRRNILPINAALVRRSAMDEVGPFDESLARADDWDFWLRCALAGKRFLYRDDPGTLALIRLHASSLTRRDRRLLPSLVQMHEKAAAGSMPPDLAAQNAAQADWLRQAAALAGLIESAVPESQPFVLIDDEKFRADLIGYPAIPFTERGGAYHGPPADDAAAAAELERHRAAGCRWAVIADVAAWHLDVYPSLGRLLRFDERRCVARPGVGRACPLD